MTQNTEINLTFEEAIAKIEEALKALSSGEIPLEQAVEQYKIGLDMVAFCQNKLKTTEAQIKILQDNIELPFAVEERI